MKVTALVPWFGAKRTIASKIVGQFGPHKSYWEPFCGSMAVLLTKPPCTMETVNDLHGLLVNLARVIQHDQLGPALYRRLRRTLFSERLFRECQTQLDQLELSLDGSLKLEAAYCYFLVSWMGMNGFAGTERYNHGFCARFTKNGGHAATRWAAAVDSIPAWRERMRRGWRRGRRRHGRRRPGRRGRRRGR